MYEITHKGAWFKWSTLDRAEKSLLTISCVAAALPGMLAGLAVSDQAEAIGYWLATGRTAHEHVGLYAQLAALPVFDAIVAATIACALVSGIAWWRFSLRQDEMFNQVQNYAFGQAGGWTLAAATLWWLMELGGWVGQFPLGLFVLLGYFLILFFWFRAVRRWA